jgi:hypothetical protein
VAVEVDPPAVAERAVDGKYKRKEKHQGITPWCFHLVEYLIGKATNYEKEGDMT